MTTRATDLRYGRRGGGWVPPTPVREHRAPHTYTELPCPERSCAGLVRRPNVRGDQWTERCDGIAAHEFTVTVVGPVKVTRPPADTPAPALGDRVDLGTIELDEADSAAVATVFGLFDPDAPPVDDDDDT